MTDVPGPRGGWFPLILLATAGVLILTLIVLLALFPSQQQGFGGG